MSGCPSCGGTGFAIEEKDGREYARPCRCRGGAAPAGDVLAACRIPPRYQHCSFDEFTAGNASLVAALEKAMTFCASFPHRDQDEGLGLLFCGDNGVGKTHLAVAVLRELVQSKAVRGQFWDFHGLIREIKNSYNPETKTSELQVLEPVVEMDVLLLDDLGAWKMTDWMNDTLFYILNGRYMAKRPTLITTNYQDVTREQAQAADPLRRREFLVERIGHRLRSRLMEMCVTVLLQGADQREVRHHGLHKALYDPRGR